MKVTKIRMTTRTTVTPLAETNINTSVFCGKSNGERVIYLDAKEHKDSANEYRISLTESELVQHLAFIRKNINLD